MKNLNNSETLLDLLEKQKNQMEPSRANFDAMLCKIVARQNLAKSKNAHLIDKKGWPIFLINNLTKNAMQNYWKFAIPSLAVVLLAIFIGYGQNAKKKNQISTNSPVNQTKLVPQEEQEESVIKNSTAAKESVEIVIAQIDKAVLSEQALLDEESTDSNALWQDDQDFNDLNNVYEN